LWGRFQTPVLDWKGGASDGQKGKHYYCERFYSHRNLPETFSIGSQRLPNRTGDLILLTECSKALPEVSSSQPWRGRTFVDILGTVMRSLFTGMAGV
jgi:hypothetical protein